MKPIKKLLQELSVQDSSRWLEKARYRRDNRNWLRKSNVIAIKILSQLNSLNLTKLDLAERSGIPIEQINDIVKGNQDLTLSTIATLEDVLGIVLADTVIKEEKKPSRGTQSNTSGPVLEGITKGNKKPPGPGTQGPPPPPPLPSHTLTNRTKESEIIKIEPEYYREGSFRERKERFKWDSWKKLYDGFRRKV